MRTDAALRYRGNKLNWKLQKPEPRPVSMMTRLFAGIETILAPLQAALLALAIRRKYMR